jgi:transposase-like protein
MKAKPQMSLAEMAARAAGTNGRLVCPKCNCTDFRTYGTIPGVASTFRYKQCRHCGKKLYTVQQPEQIVRSVDDETEEEIEGDLL